MKNIIVTLILSLMTSLAFAQSKATKKLFKAIDKNNISLAKNAIREGADVNGLNDEKAPTTTVLIRAVQLGRLEIVKLLLENHADVNQRRPIDLHTSLMVAAHHDYHQIAKLLVEYNADVNIVTVFQRTALTIAALYNSVATAEEILKVQDVDVNARPKLCALAVAARQGHMGMVTLLKKQTGTKAVNPVCLDSAIDKAEFNKHQEIVSFLKR